jgi:hypothetical protein
MRKYTEVNNSPPIFCGDCRTANTWERDPAHDQLLESGKIFELAYKCRVCGSRTLQPADNDTKKA